MPQAPQSLRPSCSHIVVVVVVVVVVVAVTRKQSKAPRTNDAVGLLTHSPTPETVCTLLQYNTVTNRDFAPTVPISRPLARATADRDR